MSLFAPVKTPCVGVCSTGIGDSVCRGCKRFAHEVIDWNAYNQSEKQLIVQRLADFLVQVVSFYLVVTDERLLREQMSHQQIRFREQQSPYAWVFDLLKAGASQIQDLGHFGVQRAPGGQGLTLPAIRDAIDQDFYTLSCAHYERYVLPGLPQPEDAQSSTDE